MVLHVPGGPGDCSEDWQCQGKEKCCHARVDRDRLVMTCRSDWWNPKPVRISLELYLRLPEELYRPLYHSWRTGHLELTEERRLHEDLEPDGQDIDMELQRVRGDRALAGDLTLPQPWATQDDMYLRRLKGDLERESQIKF